MNIYVSIPTFSDCRKLAYGFVRVLETKEQQLSLAEEAKERGD